MLEIKKNKDARELVSKTFKKINDMVVPTMGAKGLLVALDDDFGKCTITDDGVTVARQAIYLDGMEKMVAVDMIEAAATTEKEALDGTTLTILMTNALYDHGYKMIKKGKHPQNVADLIEHEVDIVRKKLVREKMELQADQVKSIATISTKIPMVGEIVDKASTCGSYGKTWADTSDYEENSSLYASLVKATNWDSHGTSCYRSTHQITCIPQLPCPGTRQQEQRHIHRQGVRWSGWYA